MPSDFGLALTRLDTTDRRLVDAEYRGQLFVGARGILTDESDGIWRDLVVPVAHTIRHAIFARRVKEVVVRRPFEQMPGVEASPVVASVTDEHPISRRSPLVDLERKPMDPLVRPSSDTNEAVPAVAEEPGPFPATSLWVYAAFLVKTVLNRPLVRLLAFNRPSVPSRLVMLPAQGSGYGRAPTMTLFHGAMIHKSEGM